MIVGGLKSRSSRRRYHKDKCEVQLIHTKPSQPLRWSEQPITFSRANNWGLVPASRRAHFRGRLCSPKPSLTGEAGSTSSSSIP
jgi:hypothetical protein